MKITQSKSKRNQYELVIHARDPIPVLTVLYTTLEALPNQGTRPNQINLLPKTKPILLPKGVT
jgi:hypothetical protein